MTIRDARPSDVAKISRQLRPEDRREAEAMYGNAHKALAASFMLSGRPLTITLHGRPVAMFGCASATSKRGFVFGHVWLMGTPAMLTFPRLFLRESRKWLAWVTKGCHASGNVVDSRNRTHLRWIEWLGYGDLQEVQVGAETFLQFSKDHV